MNQAAERSGGSVWGRIGITAVVLLALAAAGIAGIFRFVEGVRERDLRDWQVRMGIVAVSRTAAVERWLRDPGYRPVALERVAGWLGRGRPEGASDC